MGTVLKSVFQAQPTTEPVIYFWQKKVQRGGGGWKIKYKIFNVGAKNEILAPFSQKWETELFQACFQDWINHLGAHTNAKRRPLSSPHLSSPHLRSGPLKSS